METTKKRSRKKKKVQVTTPLGRYKSMDEASLAKTESAKDFIANIDMTLFKKNGHVE